MGYDFYAQDSWKPTRELTLELGLRCSLWQPWGATNNAIASFQSQFYNPAARRQSIAPTASSSAAIRSTASCCPATAPAPRRCGSSRSWPNLQRLYHGLPNGFAETPKDGLQPRLGMAYAINEGTTFRAGSAAS